MPITGAKRRYHERTSPISVDERKRRASSSSGFSTSYREAVKLLKVSTMRRAIYDVIRAGGKDGQSGSRAYDIFIAVVTVLSLLPLAFRNVHPVFTTIEHVAVYIMFIDYILRWLTHDIRRGEEGVKAFILYPISPLALCDLIGMLPTLGAVPAAFGFLRALRVGKLLYYSDDVFHIGRIFRNERHALATVLLLVVGYILIVATVIYAVEPDTFGTYFDAVYWSITSVETVGYGDFYPHGYLAKFVAMASMIFGMIVIAVPTGLITASYMQELRRRRSQTTVHLRPRSLHEQLKAFREEGGLKQYLRDHQSLTWYVRLMVFCLVIDIVLVTFAHFTGLPLWLDTLGAALGSVLLECGAGVIVGLGANIYLALITGNPSTLLYFLTPAVTAIVYARVFRKGFDPTVGQIVRTVLFITVIASIWDLVLMNLLNGGIPTGVGESMIASFLVGLGLPVVPAIVMGVLVIELIDKALCALLVLLIYNVVPDRWHHVTLPRRISTRMDLFSEHLIGR